MSDILQGLLEHLHSILQKNIQGRGIEASRIVRDVVTHCLDSVTASEIAYGSSLVFSKEYGILAFINATVQLKEFENAKADLLLFLAAYAEKIGNNLVQYAKGIKDTCVLIVNRDQSSKVKVESYNLLIQLLQTRDKSIQESLDVDTLATKFFSLCLQSSKEPAGVRGSLLHLLGVLAERFPEHLTEKADRLLSIYLGSLKQQMVVSKKPEFLVIGGCLRGLAAYLTCFTQSVEEGSKFAVDIFSYIKKAVNPKVDLARYEIPKAALNLLEKHASQFRELITDEYEFVYEVLCNWSKHVNKELKVAGLKAMDSSLYQIADCLVSRGKTTETMAILSYFLKDFHRTLNAESSSPKDLSLAIKGFGLFAQACKALLEESDLKLMFEEILNRSQHLYSNIEHLNDENLQYLPTFLEALANIVQEIHEVSTIYLLPIERMIIILFENYPKLGKGGMFMYQRSLTHFIRALSNNTTVFKVCLSRIVYQGLIRTCSHPVVTEEGITEETEITQSVQEEQITYRNFLDLWKSLLNEKYYRDVNRYDGNTKSQSLKDHVYDELIQSILFIVKKLNLKTVKEKSEESEKPEEKETSVTPSSDPLTGLVADVPKDFHIFINLVEFCRAILPECEMQSFVRWTPVYVKEIITLSARYPLVSGFYKLLEIGAKICSKLNYFEKKTRADSSELNDNKITYLLLSKYMKDVLGRVKQFKDDLLASCLQFVLNLPIQIVEANLDCFVKPMQMTLSLGLSYHSLAVTGLDALEVWISKINPEKMKSLLQEVLPFLDGYLQVSVDKNGKNDDDAEPILIGQSSHSKRNRVPIKLLKALRDASKTSLSTGTPLSQLRNRIVQFLGNIGGSMNVGIVKEGRVPDLSRAVTWDTQNRLPFAMPFWDMKPTIHLDPFLPRVIELATTSSDRQTKVVSCELLHALTLFILGKSTQQTTQNARQEGMEGIYKHLFPAVLQLGCDIEQVAEQLFRPLVFQMIRWFTSSPSKTESPDTIILLDAILDGLVSQTNSALRDFSAKCIREFLAWAIKQSSSKQLSKSAVNPKAVFKRIYSMASHPNVYKRLGAAVAFNNIYVTFREHEELVDAYTLELLTVFVDSLSMTHQDEPSIGTVEQNEEAIDHIERIIKHKSALFFKISKNRRIPTAMKTADVTDFTLHNIFDWLLHQCGRPQTQCRHKCMQLLFSLLPTTPGVTSARVWFGNTLNSDGAKFFIDRFEGGGSGSIESRMSTPIAAKESIFYVKALLHWYDKYLSALDCYTWIATAQLVNPASLLFDSSSSVLKAVEYFLDDLALESLESVMIKCLRTGMKAESNHVLTPMEKELYDKSKCTAVVRTLDFLTSTLLTNMWKSEKHENETTKIFSKNLHKIICKCIIHPESVGFNIADVEVLQKLPEQMNSLCFAMKRGLMTHHFDAFIGTLKTMLGKERYDLMSHLPVDLGGSALQGSELFEEMEQLTAGYQLLNTTGLLKHALKFQESKSLRSELLTNVLNGLLPLSGSNNSSVNPLQKRLAESMLQLALHLETEQESLIEVLLDSKPVQDYEGTKILSPRGAVFYQLFSYVINEFIIHGNKSIISLLIDRGSSFPSILALILQGTLGHISKQKTSKTDQKTTVDGTAIVKQILAKWNMISQWWKLTAKMEMKIASLNVLKGLLNIDAKATLQSPGSNAAPTLATFLQLLSDTSTGLAFKGPMFELLPTLLQGLDDKQRVPLRKSLERFVAVVFPLCSRDLIKGTSKYSEFMDCLQKLFKSLVLSANPDLLEVLLPIIVKETDEVLEKTITPSLTIYFKRVTTKDAEKSLNLCFDILLDEAKYQNEIRRGVMNRILSPSFQHLPPVVIKSFFKAKIRTIVQKIEAKLVKVPEIAFENQLVTKICCFKLIQSLYTCLSKEDLTSKTSEIVKAYLPTTETGKELTQAITKAAHAAKSEDCRGEYVLKELRREYHCAAFNTLCALIACTQTEMKFYSGFLFTENLAKGQMLWENIIDQEREFVFEAEQTVPFARKKQLQMIRRKKKAAERDETESRGFVPYLSSQYLMDSSLSQDVDQFDFSTPVQAYSNEMNSELKRSESFGWRMRRGSEELEEDETVVPEDVLEMDQINKHECMPVLVSLLKHMKESGVYKNPAEGKEGAEMPSWMLNLNKKMSSSETSTNVKIFILKLMINEPKVFEPFGKFWFSTIVQFLISGKIKGAALNYFVIDAIVVMLSWSETCIPEDSIVGRTLASSLLDFAVKNCHHNNRAVLKNNLQIIKTLTKVWKSRLDIPYRFIYDQFICTDRNTKDNMTGIQLLGVILTNGFHPYMHGVSVDEETYYSALTRNLQFKYKDVYASAAEVVGLAMKNIFERDRSTNCPLFSLAHERLVELNSDTADRFVQCLHRIQINYPQLVDMFVVQLLYILPSLHGVLKQQCLETIASRVEHFDEPHHIFTELKNKGLESALNHRDEGVQISALRVFNGLLKYLTAEQILPFLNTISKMKNSNSVSLRQNMYEMFMWIYDIYRADEQTMENQAAFDVLKISKETLLLGINDNSTEISLKLLNFWRHETRLPNSTIERFIEILRALYSTKTEREFLSYSTNLLLQLTSLSPDYSLPMFTEPLDSSKRFQEYHVNFSWQRQKIAMTPLFAPTQSQSQLMSQSQESGSSLATGILRATQQGLEFTPTQDQGGGGSINWMNPSFQIASQGSLSSQSTASQSALLFASQKSSRRSDFNKGTLGQAASAKLGMDTVDAGSAKPESKTEIMRLKRRIMKSQEKTNNYFAMKERRAQQFRETVAQRQKAARDHKVVMYRKYRAGELPDIQIKHSELIVPLQAVAQHDNVLARQLFQELFDAVMNEMPDKIAEDVMDKALTDIQQAINTMINSSVAFHPPFIYALEDACVRHKKLKLDATAAATASTTSAQQPVGIALLEKQLLENCNLEPETKRSRGRHLQQTDEVATWTELAKLYKSIDSYDFVHSIFSSQITKQENTRLALEAEARNDYAQALKLYNQALSVEDWNGNEPTREEEEFWDTARLECYNNLGQWSRLKNLALQSIDEDSPSDIGKIWDDVYLQEQFLPYYMRSNLKLLCQGKCDAAKEFGDFIDDALRREERREILESKFCDELALLRILQDNFGAAMHYINLGIQSFMEEWSNLSLLMSNSRLKALNRLQRLFEMKEFTEIISKSGGIKQIGIQGLLANWSKRLPDEKLHPVSVWDDIIVNRCVYMRKMKQRIKDGQWDISEEFCDQLDVEESRNVLMVADVARKQGNFSVATQYLRDSFDSTIRETAKESGLAIDWYHVYAKVHCDKTRRLPASEAVPSLITVLEQLHDIKALPKKDVRRNLNHQLLESSTLDCLADVLYDQDGDNVRDLFGDKQHTAFVKVYGTMPPTGKEACKKFLNQYSYSCLQSAVATSSQLNENAQEHRTLLENAIMTMVKFCDKHLRSAEEDGKEMTNDSEYAHTIIRYMLKAMTLDSKDARQRFPRLLQIISKYPETRDTFVKKAISAPCWMFLAWINQMVALLDKDEGEAILQILQSIAKEYPQALIHPLRISGEQYQFDDSPEGKRRKTEIERLTAEIKNPVCDDFIEALDQLTNPEHLFKDWQEDMKQLIEVKRRQPQLIKKCFAAIWKKLFQPVERGEKIRGEIRKRCAKEFSKKVESAFGKDGSRIADMPSKEFSEKHAKLFTEMKNVKSKPYNLKDYSPWFTNFHGNRDTMALEIPGQYTGKQKPLTEYHVQIAGFDERVLSLISLRVPKRITIRGDDEREYKFLVKGGEDLRLDQRIEQLFDIMNGILHEDPACNAKALKLKTYQVIPLTSRIGVIEWLDNTKPLKDIITDAYTDKERAYFDRRPPKAPHVEFIRRFTPKQSKSQGLGPLYSNMYKHANRSETVKAFEQTQAALPWNLLRRAFDKLSTSTEAYFVLRNHFIQTHSCICACQYILGIGDRHAYNLMLDLTTGGMVGIDFGYSFGVATTLLPVPELMPFRLTRQLVNLLLPLKDLGPYKLTIIAVLRALRNNSDVLMNTMDIFVNEPLVDWQVNARRQAIKMDAADESSSWYPVEKIAICKKKLNGLNSAYITGEELRLGKGKSSIISNLQAVAYGDPKYNIRAQLLREADKHGGPAKHSLTPEEQAACLIDQATDPNLLGRSFEGWEPFL